MPWFLYAAAVPALYSTVNLVDKYLLDKKIKDPVVIAALASLVSGALGLIFGLFTGFQSVGLFNTLLLLLAGLFLAFYLLPYLEALKLEDASRVVPMFQFIPVFTLILSSVFLHETLAPKQILGMLLVVAASIILSAKKLDSGLFRPRKALWFMLLASLMYGSVGILFRFVVLDAPFWTTLSYEYIGTGLGGILLLLIPRIRRSLTSHSKVVKSSALLITGSNGLAIAGQMSESYALSHAAVPLVNIIASLQPLVILLEGLILTKYFPKIIKEDISRDTLHQKFTAIALILCGLYLVYF